MKDEKACFVSRPMFISCNISTKSQVSRLASLFLCLIANSVSAVDISPKGTREGGVIVGINGSITDGDAEKLENSLEDARRLGLQVNAVSLNSPGGRVSAGASMAKLVRYRQLKTIVNDGATCASACFMIFAAGKERVAGKNAKIGVHSAVDPTSGENDGAKSATIDMSRFLAELGVPPPIIGKLVTAKPTDMAWLTPEDLRSMQTNMSQPPATRESYVERVAPAIEKIPNKISFEDRKKANSLLIRSYSFITASQPNEALLLLAQASKLSPYDPDIASSYGYALYLNGQHENAKNTLLLAQQLKPDFAEIYRFLAMTAAALNDRKWAKDSLLNYYKYANHKDIAIGEMRRMLIERSESDSIKLAAKEVLSIVAINK